MDHANINQAHLSAICFHITVQIASIVIGLVSYKPKHIMWQQMSQALWWVSLSSRRRYTQNGCCLSLPTDKTLYLIPSQTPCSICSVLWENGCFFQNCRGCLSFSSYLFACLMCVVMGMECRRQCLGLPCGVTHLYKW